MNVLPVETLAVLPVCGSEMHQRILGESGLFLSHFYLKAYPDIAAGGVNPLSHYCEHGWREGRIGNPYLDTGWYRETHMQPDVGEVDPLLHYAVVGRAAGHGPSLYFDPRWYRAHVMSAAQRDVDPLVHFITLGEAADKSPSQLFATGWYRSRHALGRDGKPFLHYLRNRFDGRVSPLPEFDAVYYGRMRRDVASRHMDPFQHYLAHGATEGQNPNPDFETGFYARRYLRDAPGTNPLLHYLANRHRPDVFTTLAEGLRHDLTRARAQGARRLRFPIYWHNGIPVQIDELRVFLADVGLPFGFELIWGNERMAEVPDLGERDRLLLRAWRDEPDDDADIAAFLAACFHDKRYRREGGRPVMAVYAADVSALEPAIARLRAQLLANEGEDVLVYVTRGWRTGVLPW